ncbi:ribonuclease [Raphidocelis subcapitata]|uniref:Ribonuclease n=1 Tax=Raphidocelis subcapitata TaxID=307507 RepID=A0A2V0PHT5_9CHLO|nr:ribonuclease [Raphidocelis subcapitata]|eukprot:GBF99368.1 ribonuclease [Raphidocelis subcapitata]
MRPCAVRLPPRARAAAAAPTPPAARRSGGDRARAGIAGTPQPRWRGHCPVCCAVAGSSDGGRAPSAGPGAARRRPAGAGAFDPLGYHPVSLAFLGDAVWEMYVRRATFLPPKHHSLYQAAVRPHVSAEGQAAHHDWLACSGLLTASEAALLAWAARSQDAPRLRSRFARAGAAGEAVYRKATALEALLGWLHLTDPPRLEALAGRLLASRAQGGDSDGGSGGADG